MTMVDDALQNAQKAVETAWLETQRCHLEAQEAERRSKRTNPANPDDVFVKKAKRALEAYENWRVALEAALTILARQQENLANKLSNY